MSQNDNTSHFQISTPSASELVKMSKAVMAGDSHIIYSTLTIDGKEILSESNFDVKISQKMGIHDQFQITCPTEALEGYGGYPLSQTRNYLGKSITIELKQFGKSALIYAGTISGLRHKKFDGYEGHIVISGSAPTILLENGPDCQSFEDKSLREIFEQVFQGYPQDFINMNGIPAGLPSLNERIPFTVQYKESDFAFLSRMASRYGEWFYYNGQSIILGSTGGKIVDLVEEQGLYEFELSMGIAPQLFSYSSYGEKNGSGHLVSSSSEHLQDEINPFQNFAVSVSESIYGKVPLNHINQTLGATEFDLRHLVRRQKAARQNVVLLEGRSNDPNLALGDRAKITAYMPDNKLAVNGEVPVESYKVIEISHHYDGLDGYYNIFKGIPYASISHLTNGEAIPMGDEQSAVVVENDDPNGLGRVRVQFEWQKRNGQKTPWIRMVQGHAGSGKGSYFVPEIGEEVLVGFEGKNAEKPVVLGTQYNGKEVSGFHTAENTIKAIKTRSGHLIKFTEDESIIITDKSGNEIKLDTKESNINITAPETITLTAKNIKMVAEENIECEAGKDMLNKAGKNIKTNAREEIAQDSGKKTIISSGDNTEISASKDLDLYGKKQLIGYSDAKVDIGAKDAIHIYGASSLITAKDKIEYKAPSMNKLAESGKFKFDKEKQIIDVIWMDAEMENNITHASYGEEISLIAYTRNYEEGETITLSVFEIDDNEINEGEYEIKLTGTINAEGYAELKKEIKVDKEKEPEKTAEQLKEEKEYIEYKKWEQEAWEKYQAEKKKKKGFGIKNKFMTKTLAIRGFEEKTVKIDSYVRLIFWGGARTKSDNSTFSFAYKNVKADYGSDNIKVNKASSGKDLIKIINDQIDNSIQSIDIFTHGSQYAIYMVRDKKSKLNSSTIKDIEKSDVEANNLYASKTVKNAQSWFAGDDESTINNIDFNKFTKNAKIELHGCNSGAETYMVDNIAINLSEYLYKAKKTKAVVVAHLTKANPSINGEKTTIKEQDYRHGSRIIYLDGKELFRTKKTGRITGAEIEKNLSK